MIISKTLHIKCSGPPFVVGSAAHSIMRYSRSICFRHVLTAFTPIILLTSSCTGGDAATPMAVEVGHLAPPAAAEYFMLRPEVEKAYGYTHAVRIGDDLKISGAVSMDDKGELTGAGSMDQQMKNCYADLKKVLAHYGYTFDDVVVENVFTTDMQAFFAVSEFRHSVYKHQFPTGTWLEVKGLALPGQLIEIDMEAHKSR